MDDSHLVSSESNHNMLGQFYVTHLGNKNIKGCGMFGYQTF